MGWQITKFLFGLFMVFLGVICGYTSWMQWESGMHFSLLPLWAMGVGCTLIAWVAAVALVLSALKGE